MPPKPGIFFSLFLFVFMINCTDDVKITKTSEIALFEAIHYPCETAKAVDKIMDEEFLDMHLYQDGMLTLVFKFSNTCGSAYTDSIVTADNMIQIALCDTSTTHYRCICTHRCTYDFELTNSEPVNINLLIKGYGQDDYTVCLDTLLVL